MSKKREEFRTLLGLGPEQRVDGGAVSLDGKLAQAQDLKGNVLSVVERKALRRTGMCPSLSRSLQSGKSLLRKEAKKCASILSPLKEMRENFSKEI